MEDTRPSRGRRRPEDPAQKTAESLVYGKNPVAELLKSGAGVDTVLLAEGMAPAVAAYYTALAKEAGAVAVGGMEMLVYQAVAESLGLTPSEASCEKYADYNASYDENYVKMLALIDDVTAALREGVQLV